MPFNPKNTAHLNLLKTEVETDPRSAGFSAVSRTIDIINILNTPASNPSADNVNVPVNDLLIIEAIEDIDSAEYTALPELEKQIVSRVINLGMADPTLKMESVKNLFKDAIGSGSATWTAIKSDRARPASIAEDLFGRDTIITRDDWKAARNS